MAVADLARVGRLRPDNWLPPAGRQPDRSWPPAPDEWQFWKEIRPSRRRRIRFGVLVALPGVVLFAGCAVMGALGGGCFFDPPPGDVSEFTVTTI